MEKLYSSAQLAAELGISVRQVQYHASLRRIPHIWIGYRRYFVKSHITEWIAKGGTSVSDYEMALFRRFYNLPDE